MALFAFVRPLTGWALWGAATYAVLSLAGLRVDLGEKAICGPWGCLPPLQALIAAHGFWAMVLVPGALWLVRRAPAERLGALAWAITALGLLGVAGVVGQALWTWGPVLSRSTWWHIFPRCAFDLAMFVDGPFVEATIVGLACGAIARRRSRRERSAPQPLERPPP